MFGFSHASGRITALIVTVLFLLAAHAFIKMLGYSDTFRKWYIFFLGTSPFVFYYAITLLPDLPALTAFLAALVFLIPAVRETKIGLSYLAGSLLLLLATLLKATYLFYAPVIAVIFLYAFINNSKINRLKLLAMGTITGLIVLVPNLLILLHAKKLAVISESRRPWIELSPRNLPDSLDEFINLFLFMIGRWFIGFIVSYSAFIIMAIGLAIAIKRTQKTVLTLRRLVWYGWGFSFLCLFLAFMVQFREHEYYQTSIIIIPPLFCAIGITYLLKNGRERFFLSVAVALIIISAILPVTRTYKRWTVNKQIPDELFYQADSFQKLIPSDSLVLIDGDETPLVHLYFLNRRGRVINNISRKELATQKALGFSYLVSNRDITYLNPDRACTEQHRIGNFTVCKLAEQ